MWWTMRRAIAVLSPLLALGAAACSCDKRETQSDAADAGAAGPIGLTPEQAAKVLAKVGERTITLGEYAATLERMDQFERLRYQSPERRRTLLEEMINVELLAQEARRRGLDKHPATEERVRQTLRDELRRELSRSSPDPNQIPESEVRAYYDAHRDEFSDPERRRAAHIVVADAKRAEATLERARGASPAEWGKLVREVSLDKSAAQSSALELAGDLGIVSGPGQTRGANPKVPEPVRQALFRIEKLGEVFPEVVKAGERYHIVRLTGKTDARVRTLQEAERSIRMTLAQQRLRDREAQLEQELRQRFQVVVDDGALSRVNVAAPGPSAPSSGSQP